jgi:hypothetical protein
MSSGTRVVSTLPITQLGSHMLSMREALKHVSKDSKPQVLDLYKRMYRAIPDLVRMFQMPGEAALRHAEVSIRSQFMVHKDKKDPHVIASLIENGEQELEETVMFFKTPSHTKESLSYRPDLEIARAKPQSFLADFISGKI